MRAQTSIEFLLVLALAVFILTTVIIIALQQVGGISELKEQHDATNSILDISAAAKEVYAQGEGARKQVYIILPSSYEPENSYIENRTIRLKVRGSDYVTVEYFEVHGSFPGTSGAHWVWVISEGNKVRIGNAMLSLSKNSIYVIMNRNETTNASFYVKSLWNSSINVEHAEIWTSDKVDMDISPGSGFVLGPSDKQTIDLSFSASPTAVGYYNGEMRFTASDAENNTETVRVPITIEIAGYAVEVSDALNVTPNFWAENLPPGGSAEGTFTICTNYLTAPTSVTFTPSVGPPGSWVGNTTSLGGMAPSTCVEKTLTLTVPNETSDGDYEGAIMVVGEGEENAQDTIALYVVVDSGFGGGGESGWGNGSGFCHCPVSSGYMGVPVCNCEFATIYVVNGTVVGGPQDGQPYNGTLMGGPGQDVIVGTNESDIIYTGSGNDKVCGLEGNDILYGSNSNDILDGGPGDDILYGEGSNDWLYGQGGNDIIYGGDAADDIDGGDGNDEIYGEHGDDLIYGGDGNDIIYGGDGKDTICGSYGADTIYGEVANDKIDGGLDTDTLDGGEGNDDCYRGEINTTCESESSEGYSQCGPT
ncbi:hypothetical protein KKB44_02900 [Candidatus Micrarchaeota archaeon]|nr:hypothetical protein [Candidatus Micrarchaeota archaeon]